MFRIGVFANLCQVSVRTLRLYDEKGLIKPAVVDDATSYRYYQLDQLPQLHRILALRDLGLSLEQIAPLVQGKQRLSADALKAVLSARRDELRERVSEEQARLARVEARLRQIGQEGKMPEYEVVIKKVEPVLVAGIRELIPNWEQVNPTLNRNFDAVYAYVGQQGGRPAGPAQDIWYSMDDSGVDMDVEATAPIAAPIPESDTVKVHTLPAVETMASTIYKGGFENIGEAHMAVIQWAESNGYRLAGPSRELYHQYERTGDPALWLTEIQIPVAPV
jgi:DNA-binding transcriptional MerR regulator